MIVQCTNCRARFRVADEKVPDKGVKVRCTKCANVFKVTRADAVDGAAKAPADAFGLNSTPSPGPAAAPRRNSYDLGEATPGQGFDPYGAPPVPPGRALAPPPAPRVVPNLPQAVSLTYGAASPGQALDLDLGLGPGTARAPAPRPPARAPTPPPPSANAIDAALDAAMSSGDPFGDFAAPPPPPPPRAAPPADDPFADSDFGVDLPNYGAPPPSYAAPTPPPAAPMLGDDDPFAIAPPPDEEPAPPPPPPPARAPRARPPPPSSFQPPPPPPASDDPYANLPPPREETDPFAGLAGESPAIDPKPRGAAALAAAEAAAESEIAAAGEAPSSGALSESGAAREFDFGEPSLGQKLDLDSGARSEREQAAEVARIALVAKEEKEKPKAALDLKLASRQRVRREAASAVFNVVSAGIVAFAALVVVASMRTPRPLNANDFGFSLVWLAMGYDDGFQPDQLRATALRTGTYVTRSGTELFYVQGLAENASALPRDALHVAVEMTHGSRIIGRVEAVATLAAGPEQLFALDSRRNEELQKSLAKGHDLADLRVAPHGRAPFVAVFPLTAKEVDGNDLRLTVLEGVPPTLRGSFAAAKLVTPPEPVDLVGPPPELSGTGTEAAPPTAATGQP